MVECKTVAPMMVVVTIWWSLVSGDDVFDDCVQFDWYIHSSKTTPELGGQSIFLYHM